MIQHVEQVFGALLYEELKELRSSNIKSQDQIQIGLPGEDSVKQTNVHMVLHNLHENTDLRDDTFKIKRTSGSLTIERESPPVRMDLNLVFMIQGPSKANELEALSEVTQALIRLQRKLFNVSPMELAALGVTIIQVQALQPEHELHRSPSLFWQGQQVKPRPAVGAVITLSYNPFEPVQVQLVRQVVVGMLPSASSEGPVLSRQVQRTFVSLAGIVTGVDGEPIIGAQVVLTGSIHQTNTDDRGLFYFCNLPEGQETVEITRNGYGQKKLTVEVPPAQEHRMPSLIEVTLEAESLANTRLVNPTKGVRAVNARLLLSAVGRLMFTQGEPAPYITVSSGDSATMTDSKGFYRLDLPEGMSSKVFAYPAGQDPVEIPLDSAEFILSGPNESAKSTKK